MRSDPSGFRLNGVDYKDRKSYATRGPLAAIVRKGLAYVASLPGFSPPFGVTFTPDRMALEARKNALVLDSSWQMRQEVPSQSGPATVIQTGLLKIRIAMQAMPDQAARSKFASDYDPITNYAIGFSFDSDVSDYFDAGLIIQYQRPEQQAFSASSLARRSAAWLTDVQNVRGIRFEGTNGGVFAGAINLVNPPLIDADTFVFADQFPSGWASQNWPA